ncbi:hypothetical protein [Bartonella sp. AU55XJBT]|nr:hypothetical protein [Bartonella sp. AU55XJBT]
MKKETVQGRGGLMRCGSFGRGVLLFMVWNGEREFGGKDLVNGKG